MENWTSALGSPAARAAPGPTAVTLRTAQSFDVGALLELINGYAERGLLLWRSETSLRARLGDFVVAVQETADGEEVVGCGALERLGPVLGEVRSLAVRPDAAGRGVGHGIVRRLLQGARGRGLVEVLALTRRPSFFEALSFVATRRERFTDKLETDCRHCPRNHCCDEVAMVAVSPYRIAPSAARCLQHDAIGEAPLPADPAVSRRVRVLPSGFRGSRPRRDPAVPERRQG